MSLPAADTLYFDRDWERTETLEEVTYARIAHRDASGKPLDTVRDYFYPSWQKQWEGKLAGEKPDKAMGLCSSWHENGQVSFSGNLPEWRVAGGLLQLTRGWARNQMSGRHAGRITAQHC